MSIYKVILLEVDHSNVIIFYTILVFSLDVNILQNKNPQCMNNVLNIIICEKIFELVNNLFNFTILKFDAIAIFQNGNCQASNKAVFMVFHIFSKLRPY